MKCMDQKAQTQPLFGRKSLVERYAEWVSKTAKVEGILKVTEGKKVDFYHVRPIESDYSLAFEVRKLIKGTDGNPTARIEAVYQVSVGSDSTCSCIGHSRFGYCRHHSLLTTLASK